MLPYHTASERAYLLHELVADLVIDYCPQDDMGVGYCAISLSLRGQSNMCMRYVFQMEVRPYLRFESGTDADSCSTEWAA